MLTKRDLEMIDEIMQKRIGQDVPKLINLAFEDFYDNIFEPFATSVAENNLENKKQHAEIVVEIKKLQNKEAGQDEFIKEHDKRIADLEVTPKIKN